jgi:hypothetical protein
VSEDVRGALLALADEALELQRAAEDVMAAISAEGPLDELSMRGGPLISRFEAMRRELPSCGVVDEPLLRSAAEVLDMVFANHALALHAGLDMLAVSWRSERMRDELHRLQGLGRPAIWLETIRAELAEELEAPA